MALTLSIIGAAASNGSFVTQVTAGLQSTVTAILGESSATADYVVRRKFAQRCEGNLAAVAQALAVAVATQVQATNGTHTDLTQITDTEVTNALSAIFTQQAYAIILPS